MTDGTKGWLPVVVCGVSALASLALLWSFSYPGLSFFLAAAAGLVLLGTGAVWLTLVMRGLRQGKRSGLLLAPVLVVLVTAGLVLTSVPLSVRWTVSKGSFDDVVTGLQNQPEGPVDVPSRIGTYAITGARRVAHGGLIFDEATGNLFDNAGFAYLPEGLSTALEDGSFESPQWHHLGGSWYSWNASW